jgi:hypothetical protein
MTTENQNDNIDLDDDILDGDENEGGENGSNPPAAQVPAIKPGEQEDGSFVLELEEGSAEGADKKPAEGDQPNEEGKVDDEQAAKAARRREERAEQKRRRQEKEEKVRRELASEREARRKLEERLAVIERRAQGGEVAQIDERIRQIANAYEFQKQRLTAAQEAGNAAEATAAMEQMMNLRQHGDQAVAVKKAFEQKQSTPQPLDTSVREHASKFMSQNVWYKPEGMDADSVVTRALDNALAQEGWQPNTPEYWAELQDRVKKYLPHRVAGGKVSTNDTNTARDPKPKSVVAGSGRDSAVASSKPVFKLSADRVKALKDAGIWDDPKQRNLAIQNYRDYDKANGKA